MRIEICGGTINSSLTTLDFQNSLSTTISDAESLISCFKDIKSDTYNLSGGVDSLQSALDDIDQRIQVENARIRSAESIQDKSNDFFELAKRVDNDVSKAVNQNKDELYKIAQNKGYYLYQNSSNDDRAWYEKAWDWLCGAAESVGNAIDSAWKWTKDTLKKAWDWAVEFYNEHKKIIDTILIVVGAVLAIVAVIATGGWALVPLLINVFGASASVAIAISTTVAVAAVVTTVASSTVNIVDVWCEIDNPLFNTTQKVLNISSAVLNITYSFGNIYNSFKGYRITSFEGKRVIQDKNVFDPTSLDSQGRTNLQRIKEGLSPIGKDGKKVELHHLLQTEDGGFIELDWTNHHGNYSFWHNTDPGFKSVVDHGYAWAKYRVSYWKWRVDTSYLLSDMLVNFSSISQNVRSFLGLKQALQ